MRLSVVTTLYKSEPYIDEFYTRIISEIRKITTDYQIVFVDDGSPDNSLQKAISLHNIDKNVDVIELSKNFGHHKAIMTGLQYARGDYVFLIEVDLEEKPELLGLFWEEHKKNDSIDVLYAVQKTRRGGVFEKISGKIFYAITSFLSKTEITKNMTNCRLMTKKYCKALIEFKEKDPYLAGIFSATGFNQKSIYITKYSTSETTYTLRKKISIVISFFTSFTYFPLRLIFWFGFFVTTSSFVLILYGIMRYFSGIPLCMSYFLSIIGYFVSGTVLLSLGVIGFYLSKMLTELKPTPYVIIKNIYSYFESKFNKN